MKNSMKRIGRAFPLSFKIWSIFYNVIYPVFGMINVELIMLDIIFLMQKIRMF